MGLIPTFETRGHAMRIVEIHKVPTIYLLARSKGMTEGLNGEMSRIVHSRPSHRHIDKKSTAERSRANV